MSIYILCGKKYFQKRAGEEIINRENIHPCLTQLVLNTMPLHKVPTLVVFSSEKCMINDLKDYKISLRFY